MQHAPALPAHLLVLQLWDFLQEKQDMAWYG
jgi:hypothetical protein